MNDEISNSLELSAASRISGVFTDSGYASTIDYNIYASRDTEDAELDEVATIYTDNQELDLPASARDDYIHQFTHLLYRDLPSEVFRDRFSEKIVKLLPALLKSFTLKTGCHCIV